MEDNGKPIDVFLPNGYTSSALPFFCYGYVLRRDPVAKQEAEESTVAQRGQG